VQLIVEILQYLTDRLQYEMGCLDKNGHVLNDILTLNRTQNNF